MARLAARWVRLYTRGLPAPVAQRRIEEIDADAHDHIEHERARGIDDRRIALDIASRVVRGVAADAAWRDRQADLITGVEAVQRGRTAYRRAVGVAVGAVLILVWMAGALGIIGTEGDNADLLYLGVLAIGAVGSLVARFRPAGMAQVLLAMAVAQAAVAAVALLAGLVPDDNSPFEIVALNGFFVVLFAASAWLFRRAGRHRRHREEVS